MISIFICHYQASGGRSNWMDTDTSSCHVMSGPALVSAEESRLENYGLFLRFIGNKNYERFPEVIGELYSKIIYFVCNIEDQES
jgi:hypothetical protein